MTLIVISISTDCEIQMNANSQKSFCRLIIEFKFTFTYNLFSFKFLKEFLQLFSIHFDKINENYLKIQRIKKSFFAPSFLENF